MSGVIIREKIEVSHFVKQISKYKDTQIECTQHARFRLSEKQREIYTAKELTRILLHETPFLVGLQEDEKHAVFYRHENKVLKVIVAFSTHKVYIITFYFIQEWQIPKL